MVRDPRFHGRTGLCCASATLVALAVMLLFVIPVRASHTQTCNGGHISVPDGVQMVCSGTWQFSGICTGADLWDKWKVVAGQSTTSDAFIRPWAETPITVIGYELVKLQSDEEAKPDIRYRNDHQSWFMIGSGINSQPDAMLWLAPGETHAHRMWPAGIGHIWPASALARHATQYEDILDLHGTCFGGGPITIFLTIYYTPQG